MKWEKIGLSFVAIWVNKEKLTSSKLQRIYISYIVSIPVKVNVHITVNAEIFVGD